MMPFPKRAGPKPENWITFEKANQGIFMEEIEPGK